MNALIAFYVCNICLVVYKYYTLKLVFCRKVKTVNINTKFLWTFTALQRVLKSRLKIPNTWPEP